MLRHALALALFASAAPCWAETAATTSQHEESEVRPAPQDDRFVISSDACGASRYRHLLDQDTRAQPISMPEHALIVPNNIARTLEYTPHRLNVVVDETGRIVSVGCYWSTGCATADRRLPAGNAASIRTRLRR